MWMINLYTSMLPPRYGWAMGVGGISEVIEENSIAITWAR